MKKLFLIILLSLSFLTSFSQLYIGGDGKVHSAITGGAVANSNEITFVSDTTAFKHGFAKLGSVLYYYDGVWKVLSTSIGIDTTSASGLKTIFKAKQDSIFLALATVLKLNKADSATDYATPKRLKDTSFALRSLIAASTSPQPFSYYVDSRDGNDNNNGLLPSTAFKTLAKVLTVINDNGTIQLACNSVFRESLIVTTVNNLTIKSYGSGEKPIITGSEIATGWTNYSGNVWYKDVTVEAATGNRGYAGIWENDARLKEYVIGDSSTSNLATIVALLQSNPNSFYFTGVYASGWSAGNKRYYINVGGNPNTNGKVYENNSRNYVIYHDGAIIEGLQLEKCQHHDGVIVGNFKAGQITNCVLKDFGRHGIIDPSSSMTDCLVKNGNPKYPGGFYHPYSSSVTPLATAPRYLRCTALGDYKTGFTGFFGHGSGFATHEKIVFTDCKAIGLGEGFGSFEVNYVDFINCKTEFCTTDFIATAFYRTTITNCTGIGASECAINLPAANRELVVTNSKFATALTSLTKAPFFSNVNAGSVYFNNVEFTNQGSNPVGTTLPYIYIMGNLQKLSIRNSYMTNFNGYFNAIIRANSVASFDIPDNQLLIGDIPKNSIIGGTTADISTNAGVGVVQELTPKKLYPNFPLTAGFIKSAGTNFPITSGTNYVVAESNLQPRGIVYYGKKIGVDLYATNDVRFNYTPSSELLSGYFTVATPYSEGYHVGIGKNGLITRSTAFLAGWEVKGAGVTTKQLNGGCSDGDFFNVSTMDIVVGDSGVILKSTNNGGTWTALTSGVTTNLKSVAIATIATIKNIIVVGEGGVILKSVDDGATWTAVTSGVTVTLNKIIFAFGSFVIAGNAPSNSHGLIMTSTNGTSWTSRKSNTFKSIKNIHFNNNLPDATQNRIIATLDESGLGTETLITSTDAMTWKVIPVLVPFAVTGLSYFENQVGWVLSGKTAAGIGSSFDGYMWNFKNPSSVDVNSLKTYYK